MLKPVMISLAYHSCRIMFYDLLRFSIVNPTLTMGLWMYNMIVYTNLECRQVIGEKPTNMYKLENMGRWIWIYAVAQLLAAPVAGFVAKNLLEVVN